MKFISDGSRTIREYGFEMRSRISEDLEDVEDIPAIARGVNGGLTHCFI